MENALSEHRKLILWGMMGSGKTYLASRLSSFMDVPFLDLDQYVEQLSGQTIRDLFLHFGEDHFRDLEHETLVDVLGKPRQLIVALGGGTPCFQRNQDLFLHDCLTVYLQCSEHALAARLIDHHDHRPLLDTQWGDLELRLSSLLAIRASWYERANVIVNAEDPHVLDRLSDIARDYFHS